MQAFEYIIHWYSQETNKNCLKLVKKLLVRLLVLLKVTNAKTSRI